jgi:hypothetical protein
VISWPVVVLVLGLAVLVFFGFLVWIDTHKRMRQAELDAEQGRRML